MRNVRRSLSCFGISSIGLFVLQCNSTHCCKLFAYFIHQTPFHATFICCWIPRFAPIPSPSNQAFCIRPCVPPAEFQPDLVRHCALRRRTRQTVSFSRANVTKFNDKRARHVKLRYVHSTWTESAWSSQAAVVNACYPMQQLHSACAERSCNKSTQLRDAFIGQASQRHDLIGCSETRTVGAQSVRALWTPPLEYTSSVQFLCCKQPLKDRLIATSYACMGIKIYSGQFLRRYEI